MRILQKTTDFNLEQHEDIRPRYCERESSQDLEIYTGKFGKNARLKFRHEIAHVSQLLLQNPNLGPAEPYLADAPVLYRSIVVNRLNKIIY